MPNKDTCIYLIYWWQILQFDRQTIGAGTGADKTIMPARW